MKRTFSEAFGPPGDPELFARFARRQLAMPRRTMRRRTTRRRSFKSRRPNLRRRVNTLSRRVSAMRPEVKYNDLSAAGATFNFTMGTSAFIATAGISQGTGDFGSRIGDQITLMRLISRMTFAFPPGITATKLRIIFFQYKQNPDAITVVPTSVCNLYMESAYDGTVNIVNAPHDFDNRHSFVTLYDKTMSINQETAAATHVVHKTINLDLHKSKLSFSNATTAVVANAIYCIVVSDTTTVANMSYVQRIFYTDN